ncbi:MAG: hypothetical protein M0Q45_03035 [Bacteroidales bacterium]|nr:hypothetical protein [Bacteroidales bacterium]MCK9498460.1 hypothetical protein [Bacteroidales bacterium]MDY0315724.1 hypothetical protein [Bacteroidales bacterium]
MMKIKIIYILIIFLSINSYAQDKEVVQLIISGDKAFQEKNWYGAAKLYEKALKFNHRMQDIVWKTAQAYRLDNDYVRAAKHYRYLTEKNQKKYPEAIYYYAEMLKANEEFIKAQYNYQKFIEINEKDDNNLKLEKSKQEILNCEKAWKMYNNPSGIEVIQCDSNINSVYSDFSTSFYKDSILTFASIKPLNDSVRIYKSKIYQTIFFEANNSTELFDKTINKPDFDIANPHFSKDGKTLWFTISESYETGNTYIYTSENIDNKWTEPQKLPDIINKPNYNSTQPFMLEREGKNNIFLFSSDRPEGEGGYDIYYVEVLPDNSWGYVRNLGRAIIEDQTLRNFLDTTSLINTPGNEITPFYNDKDSCLYFSSDWYENLGGYDIFKVKGNFRVWEEVENLGYPINTAQNDSYYKIYPEQGLAFFTSNRKSAFAIEKQSCCNDLFYHELEKEIIPELITERKITTIITKTKLLVPITLYFHNDQPVPNSWDTVTNLNYTTTYYDYLNLQENYRKMYSRGLAKSEKLIAIDSIDYYFSYNVQDNYNKLLEFTNLMQELLNEGQKIIITIKGYTSPLNTAAYNINLAKRRISSLVNYFAEYENGLFIPYLESGQLEYEFVAFGKTLSDGKVSDDPKDPRNSIYSPAASRERKIEIIAISVVDIEQN